MENDNIFMFVCPVCGDIHRLGTLVVFLRRRCRQRYERLPPNRQAEVRSVLKRWGEEN